MLMEKLKLTESINIRVDKETLSQFDKSREDRPRPVVIRRLMRLFIKGEVIIRWDVPEEEETDFLVIY